MLGILFSVLPFVLIAVIAYSGVAFICSFAEGKANDNGVEVNISSMSAEKLLEVIKDKDKVSNDTIEDFYMKRRSIANILKYVCDYNDYKGRKEEADVYLEMFKQWRGTVAVPNPNYEEEIEALGKDGDPSSVPLYITVIAEYSDYIAQPHTISNRWLTDKYKMDWQILYVFCLYQAIDDDESSGDEANEEEEIDEEELADDMDSLEDEDDDVSLVTVKKKKIKEIGQMVEPSYKFTWNAVEELKGYAFSFNPAGMGSIAYGYPIDANVPDTSCYDGYYSLTGKIHTSNIDTVQLLTRKDYYEMAADGTTCNLVRTEYNAERLYALLEAYGGGRDMEIFLTSLEELPQGKELVNRILYDLEHEGEVVTY